MKAVFQRFTGSSTMVFYSESAAAHIQNAPPATGSETFRDRSRDLPDANNLVTTFIVFAALVLQIGMLLFGTWVTQRSADAVRQHSAHSAAMFMDSSIEPLVQELATGSEISPRSITEIDALLAHEAVRQKLSGIAIWRRDGVIAYAQDRSLIGTMDKISAGYFAALNGNVEIEQFDASDGIVAEVVPDAQGVYRIFSPIHKLGTNEIIAIGGYFEQPQQLEKLLEKSRRDTWVVVAAFTLLIFGLTFGLIKHASEMIKAQNNDLRERFAAQVRLNLQNEILRKELLDAQMEGIAINENFLRRIGADLHDGPAQFLALALLRLDDVGRPAPAPAAEPSPPDQIPRASALETVRSATQNALAEIRSISTGLALPELANRSAADIIGAAINTFMSATQTNVLCHIGRVPDRMPLIWTVCLFRFVQEGLNNGYRHADGKGQTVRAESRDESLIVEVADQGPGFDPAEAFSKTSRLGLLGLRHRIETLGGEFEIKSTRGEGTTIVLTVPLSRLIESQ